MNEVKSGTFRLIRTTGKAVEYNSPPDLTEIKAIIGAESLDTVNLQNGCVMLLDDRGYDKSLPDNPDATKLYHDICYPGTTHRIKGDVVIVRDSDFA